MTLPAWPTASPAQVPASITLDAATTLTTFIPVNAFGINTAAWQTKAEHNAAQPKVQAAGNFFCRWPGGSADDVHWNGKGTYNANHYWVPDDTLYMPSFNAAIPHLGTSYLYGLPSRLLDGDTSTTWLSNPDTDFPNAQWVYLDFAVNKAIDGVTIVWGTPYATQFTLQYWDSTASDQWAPYLDTASHWLDTTASAVVGTGGTQGVTFTAVSSRYLRLLLSAASGPVTADLGSVTVTGPAYAIAELRAYQGATQLTVNSPVATTQTKAVASSCDPASAFGYAPDLDFESFMAFAKSFTPYVPPVLSVNLGTGTPQEAAAWVHYANLVKGYGIKYWQLGNEIEGDWEWGGPLNTRDYARRYIEYYEAMKAVDPSIILTGPVNGSPYSSSNLYDGKSSIQDFVYYLDAWGKASYVDALDYHWYPTFQPEPEASVLATTSQVPGIASSIAGWISGTAVNPQVPVFMSEYNIGPGGLPMLDQWVDGLWLADSLGLYTKSFGPRAFSNFFGIIAGASDLTDATQGDLGYLQVEPGPYQDQERGTYWAYKMVATDWATSADTTPHPIISTTSSQPLLGAYADYRPDHVLSLMVVNKDPANTYAVTLSLSGITPNSTADGWTFDPSNYAWDTSSVPYHANPDLPPSPMTLTGVSSSFPVTIKPYSLTVLHFTDSAYPTSTPSVAATSTFTVTSTATPSGTPTPSPTVTATPSRTVTAFPSPIIGSGLYPNPIRGNEGCTLAPGLATPSDVEVQFFTMASRRISDLVFRGVLPGQALSLPVNDGKGGLLANGLYFVVVTSDAGREIRKLLVLR